MSTQHTCFNCDAIRLAYERWKHLDQVLSDKQWMSPEGDDSDAGKLARIMNGICHDLWGAVKQAAGGGAQ